MQGSLIYSGSSSNHVALLPETTVTASGTGIAVSGLGEWGTLILQFAVSAAATTADDLLDVYLQTTIDGTNWFDIYHFAQVLGDGGTKRFYGKVIATTALTEFETGTALDAAAGRAVFGDSYRVRWVVVDDSESASFTFSVKANVS